MNYRCLIPLYCASISIALILGFALSDHPLLVCALFIIGVIGTFISTLRMLYFYEISH